MQAGNKIDHPAVNQKNLIQEVQTIGQEFLRRDVDRRQSGQPHNIPSLFFVSFLDIQSSLGFAKVFCVFLCGDFVENLLWKCGNLFENNGLIPHQP